MSQNWLYPGLPSCTASPTPGPLPVARGLALWAGPGAWQRCSDVCRRVETGMRLAARALGECCALAAGL